MELSADAEHPNVLHALIRKRAKVAGQIEHNQLSLRKLSRASRVALRSGRDRPPSLVIIACGRALLTGAMMPGGPEFRIAPTGRLGPMVP